MSGRRPATPALSVETSIPQETSDWRDSLWTAHRSLFEGCLPFATGIGTLPVGWRELVESLCTRLTVVATAASGHVRVSRIREDRAVLEVVCEAIPSRPGSEAEVAEIVARAAARSACTCETCGQAGRRYRVGFWMFTACLVHTRRGAIEVVPNWPTIRTERAFVEGRPRIVKCEAYDRGFDRFVASSPAALGIEDSP
jgi:hypothetical protein